MSTGVFLPVLVVQVIPTAQAQNGTGCYEQFAQAAEGHDALPA